MRTLYVSDLDGTLLRSDERTSDFTNAVVNELVEKGLLFSYATARSYHTAHKVTRGLYVGIPLIIYNGAFIMDNATGKILLSNYFQGEADGILSELLAGGVYPIVYAFIDGKEKFSFIESKCSERAKQFLATRKGDIRTRAVSRVEELFCGDIFYFTCIDEWQKLEPFYERYRGRHHCVYQKEFYSKDQWLEIMPREASKSRAVLKLKEYLCCDRVVAFGDGANDIDMFEIADESYAVGNAVDELKAVATGVIESNDSDGVAKFLKAHG